MKITLNRRKFLRLCSLTGAALAVGATTVTLDGCTFSITDVLNTIIDSALAILKVAEPGASWIGTLSNAIAALQQSETQWSSGGAATIVVDALNTLEAVLAVIPVTAAYSPLIDIIIAGIEEVMQHFGLTMQLSRAASLRRAAIVNSPHYKKVEIKGPSLMHPTYQGAYKAQWNAQCDALKLPQAKLK